MSSSKYFLSIFSNNYAEVAKSEYQALRDCWINFHDYAIAMYSTNIINEADFNAVTRVDKLINQLGSDVNYPDGYKKDLN